MGLLGHVISSEAGNKKWYCPRPCPARPRPLVPTGRLVAGAGNPRTSVGAGVVSPVAALRSSAACPPPSPPLLVSFEPTQRYPGPRRGLTAGKKGTSLVPNCCVIRCCDASKMIRWCVESISLWDTHSSGMLFPHYQFDCFFWRNLSLIIQLSFMHHYMG